MPTPALPNAFRLTWATIFTILAAFSAQAISAAPSGPLTAQRYNVVWDSPSTNSSGSMPLGNGDIGLNVWAEPDGDLLFYISKTDAWNEDDILLKLGRIRVKITPNPFAKGAPFRQELRLPEGQIVLTAGPESQSVTLRLWVDALRPVIHLQASGRNPFDLQVQLESWRTQPRRLTGKEADACREMTEGSYDIIVDPDTILPAADNRLAWCHRNQRSCYQTIMKEEQLTELIPKYADPYLGRTFGGLIEAPGLQAKSDTILQSPSPAKQFDVNIHVLTAQTDSTTVWLDCLRKQAAQTNATPLDEAWRSHVQWWTQFWDRSWIHVSPRVDQSASDESPFVISRGYALQRFIAACAGRGAQPIKFNGSIFTVDDHSRGFNADFRAWGGGYWFQNTRLAYWPMLAAGDFDLMQPWFRMYTSCLPLMTDRTRLYYKHDGACFVETMLFWGPPAPCDWGWGNRGPEMVNNYIKYYWSGGLELIAAMLDYYDRTEDASFARDTLLSIAVAVTTFYDQHWKRGPDGKIRFDPAQSIETWHSAVDPLPIIAGLRVTLPRLIALPDPLATDAQRAAWKRTLADLPDVPIQTDAGTTFLLPAVKFDRLSNSENPELYAVFPYRLFGLGKPDLPVGLETFQRRRVKRTGGWTQDAIQAAYLGLTDRAASDVAHNFATKHDGSRFPAFWGPNFDWIPDQDHGSVAMIALQRMLMQCEGRKILLLPAWPKSWNVEFKLHAPFHTTVEGRYVDGKLQQLTVTPAARRDDVTIVSAD